MTFAQLERETTAERVRDNYIHRFTLGAWPGGPAPYGFGLSKSRDACGRLVSALLANDKAETVRSIFREYAQPEASLRSIAKSLSGRGVHGPKREVWDNVTLSRLLHSPLYVRAAEDIYFYYLGMGLQIQQDIEAFDGVHACNVIGRRDRSRNKYNSPDGQMLTVANHEGFIEPELWLKVQDKLRNNPQISRSNAGKYSWLTGLLKCGKCGYAVKINFIKAENRHYLICSGRSNLSVCGAAIQADLRELEASVAAAVQSAIDECPPETFSADAQSSAGELLAIEQKIERLVAALSESGDVSAAYISRQIEKLHKERESLFSKPASAPDKPRKIDFSRVSFEEKKLIAGEFISRIELIESSADVIWRI
jgi:hypothetical protein